MGLHRTLNGPDHLMERRQMNDGLHPLHDLLAKRAISHIPLDKFHCIENRIEILSLPREKIVQDSDTLSPSHERLDHVRADKAGSACHQIPRHCVPRSRFTAPCLRLGNLRYNWLNATLWKPAAAIASRTAGLINASNSRSCR